MNWPNALSVVKKSAVASKENKQSTATAKTTHSIWYSYYGLPRWLRDTELAVNLYRRFVRKFPGRYRHAVRRTIPTDSSFQK